MKYDNYKTICVRFTKVKGVLSNDQHENRSKNI